MHYFLHKVVSQLSQSLEGNLVMSGVNLNNTINKRNKNEENVSTDQEKDTCLRHGAETSR